MARVEHSSPGFDRSRDDKNDHYKESSGKDRREDDGEDRKDSTDH